jgi:hypothetical protein
MEHIDELISKLAQDAVDVKPAPHPYLLSLKWVGGAVIYLLLSLMVTGLRPDIGLQLQQPWFVAEIVALFGILVSTSLSAALLSFPDLHQMRKVAFSPVIAFALFLLVMLLAWQADNSPAALPSHRFECTACITLLALLPAAWTFFDMRKFASTHFNWAGSVALLSAFSVGALWERLHEVNDSILHVVEWHYLPMIVFGVVGLRLGKMLLKW